MKVVLRVLSGESNEQEFVFSEPGGFTFGRAEDCTCRMPGSDTTFSRHHFLLEIIPPNVTLKDLGSLNGTYVNDTKHGGRSPEVRPEDAEPSPALPLRDGDRVEAGRCVLEVQVDAPALCVDCGKEIPREERKEAEFVGGTYLCKACREKEAARKREREAAKKAGRPTPAPADMKMDTADRQRAEGDPAAVVDKLMRMLAGARDHKKPPAIQGYRDIRKLGDGGFGAVYAATRASDGVKVALKTMLQTRRASRRSMLMFDREKEIVMQLRHPNIVHCYNASVWNDVHFIEMEYMDGGDLFSLMMRNGGRLPLGEAASILLDALEGLAHAHGASVTVTTKTGAETVKGVVHRDLKPPNVLLSGTPGNWTAKLADFGLAKAFSEAGMTKGSITADVGAFCGSLPFIAPEHLVNYRQVKPATDVFEIAATFYHVLTGRTVWPVRRGMDPLKAVLEGSIKPINKVNRDIPKGVAAVFEKALARKEDDRYPDGAAMLEAMRKAL